jgi:hypothetical protein
MDLDQLKTFTTLPSGTRVALAVDVCCGISMSRADESLTSAARISGLLIALLAAGCAGLEPSPASKPTQIARTQNAPAALEPAVPAAASKPESTAPGATESRAIAVEPMAPAAASPSASQIASKPAPPAAKPPAKAPAPPAPAREVAKKESPAPGPVKPAGPPPLDLNTLETRLKETKAIGVLTKLTIKNQVDDLLDQFKAFYQGRLKTTLGELRQPYDRLVLKVVALLQDADPPLAGAIVASREAIWAILADPAKFANH